MAEKQKEGTKTAARKKRIKARKAIPAALVAILDRHGMVVCVAAGPTAARSFLMEAAQ